MKQERSIFILACFGSTAVVASAAWLGLLYDPRRAISFDNLQHACAIARTKGFHCSSDREDGIICASFVISREPMTWQEVGEICKCGRIGTRWNGRVWLVLSTPYLEISDAAPRVWGKVWAFGDIELLDEIERRCQ